MSNIATGSKLAKEAGTGVVPVARVASSAPEPPWWPHNSRSQRPAITEGFVMPNFAGKYWIWPEEYALVAKYVDLTQGNYLEIGSMCGIIAMSLAQKYPARHFTCVDGFLAGHGTIAGEKGTFLRNLREHNLKNIELVEGDSLEVVPKLSGPFDVAFVDANHAYEYVFGDALNCWSLLATGGFIIFHDYDCVEETTQAVNRFLKETGAQAVEKVSSLVVFCKSVHTASSDVEMVEIERLKRLLDTSEHERRKAVEEKNRLEVAWQSVEDSAGWRLLNSWRRAREKLLPLGSQRRKFYDGLLRSMRG